MIFHEYSFVYAFSLLVNQVSCDLFCFCFPLAFIYQVLKLMACDTLCLAGDRDQGFVHAGQALYQLQLRFLTCDIVTENLWHYAFRPYG